MKIIEKIKNSKTARSGVNYSLSATTASVVSMIVSLLNMRWLGPSELGVWQSLCVVSAYIPFLQLGVQSGLNLELPVLLGSGKGNKAKEYIASAYYISIMVTVLILSAGLIATLIVWYRGLGLKYVFGILALTGVNVGNSIVHHFVARYRSAMSFDILTAIVWLQLLVSVLCIPMIYFWGYWGLLIYNAVPIMIYAFMMYKRSPFADIKPHIDKNDSFYLIKRGTIQMVYAQSSMAIKTFQQMFLLRFGGTTFVGLFSPALAIGTVINLLPGQFSQFLVPQMGYRYGQSGNAKDLWPYIKKLLLFMPLLILPFSIVLAMVLPWLVNTFFPKYVESITAMQIMAFGFIFSTSSITTNFLYTMKAYKEATYIVLSEFICYLLLPTFLYKVVGLQILSAVAAGVSIAYFIIYVTTFIVMRITLHKSTYNTNYTQI